MNYSNNFQSSSDEEIPGTPLLPSEYEDKNSLSTHEQPFYMLTQGQRTNRSIEVPSATLSDPLSKRRDDEQPFNDENIPVNFVRNRNNDCDNNSPPFVIDHNAPDKKDETQTGVEKKILIKKTSLFSSRTKTGAKRTCHILLYVNRV